MTQTQENQNEVPLRYLVSKITITKGASEEIIKALESWDILPDVVIVKS